MSLDHLSIHVDSFSITDEVHGLCFDLWHKLIGKLLVVLGIIAFLFSTMFIHLFGIVQNQLLIDGVIKLEFDKHRLLNIS